MFILVGAGCEGKLQDGTCTNHKECFEGEWCNLSKGGETGNCEPTQENTPPEVALLIETYRWEDPDTALDVAFVSGGGLCNCRAGTSCPVDTLEDGSHLFCAVAAGRIPCKVEAKYTRSGFADPFLKLYLKKPGAGEGLPGVSGFEACDCASVVAACDTVRP